MQKPEVINRLLQLVDEVRHAELEVYGWANEVHSARQALEAKEAELLAGPTIDGKNAETRKAQLFQQTEAERADLRNAENRYARAQVDAKCIQSELSILRSVARLMASDETG